jgi:hypothetical protein
MEKVFIKPLNKEGVVTGWHVMRYPDIEAVTYNVSYDHDDFLFQIAPNGSNATEYNRMRHTSVFNEEDLMELPVVSKSCDHSWKTYDSGWTKYEYCAHCDTKKA